jgi:predicted HAD superfamily phosphohydrolase
LSGSEFEEDEVNLDEAPVPEPKRTEELENFDSKSSTSEYKTLGCSTSTRSMLSRFI